MQKDSAGKVKLSVREAQLLYLLATEALSTKETAERLNLAYATVAGYIDDLLCELEICGRNKLILWALQHPEAFAGEAVDPRLHPPGCDCPAGYCRIFG